ncbi:MAG: LPS export ABC transporter permease LptG [Pseudomonadota bacterium]
MIPPLTLFRYLCARLLLTVGLLYLIFSSLIILIDLIENLRFSGKVEGADFVFALRITLLRTPALVQTLTPFIFLFGAIAAFSQLNRRSELAVMRSAGVSVWRVLGPSIILAITFGTAIVLIVDPTSAKMLAHAEQLKNDVRGKKSDLVRVLGDGIWLRQRTDDALSLINAREFDAEKAVLQQVTIWRLDPEDASFRERIDSPQAVFTGNTITLRDARAKNSTDQRARFAPTMMVESTLTAADLTGRVSPPETMPIWELPRFAKLAETAGLPTIRYEIRFHDLLSTPVKLMAMVLIAAIFSFRPWRQGGVVQLMLLSVTAGFALYILTEVSLAIGESGVAPPSLAAWTPSIAASLFAITRLLQIEDG